MGLRDLVYSVAYPAYEWRLRRHLDPTTVPRHVGLMADGNRRWARASGLANITDGHRRGAANIPEFLGWCDEVGVELVTLWLLSTDNLARDPRELQPLLSIIEELVDDLALPHRNWQLRIVGALDLLPPDTTTSLKAASERTVGRAGAAVNVAVGYGGRREIADAVRSLLSDHASRGTTIEELVELLDVDLIAEHLYTKGQPDPDLVIRTSGEQRLGGFLLWQSVHSEFYFCDAYWPEFRKVDFLRALRAYAGRQRRYGG